VLEILYRDDDVVAVHKPSGLMVHRSDLDRRETRFAVQLLRTQVGRRVFPAHRLDRGTSGVLLFAFDARVAARLGQAFESRAVDKRYIAIVRGWPDPAGVIEHPLRRLEDGKDVDEADARRQDARTDYRRLACAEVPIPSSHHDTTRIALVEVFPRTGRQHQIRRHLKHVSHPVIGDATYGKGPLNRAFAALFGAGRLLLACVDLYLVHPADGRPLLLRAPLEPAFAALCVRLGWEPPPPRGGDGRVVATAADPQALPAASMTRLRV
jgi:tRNA pseudouridine65 synthase